MSEPRGVPAAVENDGLKCVETGAYWPKVAIILDANADTLVVLLNGVGQTGKSTLAQEFARSESIIYFTLADATQLAAASSDARGFLAGLGDRADIDEVQKAPGWFPAIKMSVDRDRRPGGYLLTASANALLFPQISESLAGRMELITLLPISQGDLRGWRKGFLTGCLRKTGLCIAIG